MLKLTAIFATGMLLAAPVVAHDHDNDDDRLVERDASPMDRSMQGMGDRLTDEQVQEMQAHLEEMQDLMRQVREEEDPERRQELLEEHAERMQEGMAMIMSQIMQHHAEGDIQPGN